MDEDFQHMTDCVAQSPDPNIIESALVGKIVVRQRNSRNTQEFYDYCQNKKWEHLTVKKSGFFFHSIGPRIEVNYFAKDSITNY